MNTSYLTQVQVDQLLRPINPARVFTRDGMAYVEAYDDKAHLNRIFGFGRWSSEVVEQALLFEEPVQTKAGKPAWYVGYRSVVRLTIKAPDGTELAVYTEGHVGDSTHPSRGEAHGNAVTNSESYALKRCASFLGDQFGLSLYGKGSRAALVKRTLVMPEPQNATDSEPVDRDVAPIVPEHPEPEPDVPPMTSAPVDPLPGAEESAAPSPDSPVQDSPPEPVDPQVAVGALREQVIDLLKPPINRREALQKLTRLQIQAGKDRLMEQETHNPLGEPCTVQMLLDGALKLIARKESAA